MTVSDDHQLDRLRLADPLAGVAPHGVDPDAIVAGVERLRTVGRRRRHRRALVACAAVVVLAVVAVPLSLSPSGRTPEALALHGTVRVAAPSAGANGFVDYGYGDGVAGAPVASTGTVTPSAYVITWSGDAVAKSTDTAASEVWSLTWRQPLPASARLLARAFGLRSGRIAVVRRDARGIATEVRVTGRGGSSIVLATRGGTVHWSFGDASAALDLTGASATPPHGWSPPRTSQSIVRARGILRSLHLAATLSDGRATRAGPSLWVDFEVVAGGRPTDLTMQFRFAPGGALESANGVLATLSPRGSYAAVPLDTAFGELQTAGRCAGTSPRHHRGAVLHVVLERATPRLATFLTVGGVSLLVPVWRVVGRTASRAPDKDLSFLAEVVDARPVRLVHGATVCHGG